MEIYFDLHYQSVGLHMQVMIYEFSSEAAFQHLPSGFLLMIFYPLWCYLHLFFTCNLVCLTQVCPNLWVWSRASGVEVKAAFLPLCLRLRRAMLNTWERSMATMRTSATESLWTGPYQTTGPASEYIRGDDGLEAQNTTPVCSLKHFGLLVLHMSASVCFMQ